MSWIQSARRRGSKFSREIQIEAKRQMPEWHEIVPAIIRAFERLRKSFFDSDDGS